jgi:hypothetical protein
MTDSGGGFAKFGRSLWASIITDKFYLIFTVGYTLTLLDKGFMAIWRPFYRVCNGKSIEFWGMKIGFSRGRGKWHFPYYLRISSSPSKAVLFKGNGAHPKSCII